MQSIYSHCPGCGIFQFQHQFQHHTQGCSMSPPPKQEIHRGWHTFHTLDDIWRWQNVYRLWYRIHCLLYWTLAYLSKTLYRITFANVIAIDCVCPGWKVLSDGFDRVQRNGSPVFFSIRAIIFLKKTMSRNYLSCGVFCRSNISTVQYCTVLFYHTMAEYILLYPTFEDEHSTPRDSGDPTTSVGILNCGAAWLLFWNHWIKCSHLPLLLVFYS